jgi:hypothetical protein
MENGKGKWVVLCVCIESRWVTIERRCYVCPSTLQSRPSLHKSLVQTHIQPSLFTHPPRSQLFPLLSLPPYCNRWCNSPFLNNLANTAFIKIVCTILQKKNYILCINWIIWTHSGGIISVRMSKSWNYRTNLINFEPRLIIMRRNYYLSQLVFIKLESTEFASHQAVILYKNSRRKCWRRQSFL